MQPREGCGVLAQDAAQACGRGGRQQPQQLLLLRARHVQQVPGCVEGSSSRMTAMRALRDQSSSTAVVLFPRIFHWLFTSNRFSSQLALNT